MGEIAYGDRQLEGEQFATFDRDAAKLLLAEAEPVLLL